MGKIKKRGNGNVVAENRSGARHAPKVQQAASGGHAQSEWPEDFSEEDTAALKRAVDQVRHKVGAHFLIPPRAGTKFYSNH